MNLYYTADCYLKRMKGVPITFYVLWGCSINPLQGLVIVSSFLFALGCARGERSRAKNSRAKRTECKARGQASTVSGRPTDTLIRAFMLFDRLPTTKVLPRSPTLNTHLHTPVKHEDLRFPLSPGLPTRLPLASPTSPVTPCQRPSRTQHKQHHKLQPSMPDHQCTRRAKSE